MRNFVIVQQYCRVKRRGRWNLLLRGLSGVASCLRLELNVGYRFRRTVRGKAQFFVVDTKFPFDARRSENQTIYMRASARGWSFPYRIKWILQSTSHESIHKAIEKILNEDAPSTAFDNLPDKLWREYC